MAAPLRSLWLALCLVVTLAHLASAAPPKEVPLNEDTKDYKIAVRYPKISAATPGLSKSLNEPIEAFVRATVDDFKKEFADAVKAGEIRYAWDLSLNYTVPFQSARLMSVDMVGSTFTGGAHPNPFFQSFVLDLKTGKSLALADMFKPGSEYLKVLSAYCLKELKSRGLSDDEWLGRGAGPEAANYAVSFPVKDGFQVVFPTYQVAPYVAGPQEVLVPYSELREVLDPAGPLGEFLVAPAPKK